MAKEFDFANEAAVFTSTYVTRDGMAILYVVHGFDEEDGEDWEFHCGNGDYSTGKLQLVRLDTILRLDPSIVEVADLPIGFTARRAAVGAPWQYTPNRGR